MAVRKTLIKSEAGVRLERIEQLSGVQKVISAHYRLSTMRPNQPRVLADQTEAEDAYDLEVIASLLDPTVQGLIEADT